MRKGLTVCLRSLHQYTPIHTPMLLFTANGYVEKCENEQKSGVENVVLQRDMNTFTRFLSVIPTMKPID